MVSTYGIPTYSDHLPHLHSDNEREGEREREREREGGGGGCRRCGALTHEYLTVDGVICYSLLGKIALVCILMSICYYFVHIDVWWLAIGLVHW